MRSAALDTSHLKTSPESTPALTNITGSANWERDRMANATVPNRMLKWNFYGDGLDSLHAEETPVPSYGPDELLVRQDACGLCFSDTKVIALGANHPRMVGRDLKENPVTLGHEVSCT